MLSGFISSCVLAWYEWRIVHTVHWTAPQPRSSVHKVCEVCKNDAYSHHQIQHLCKSVNQCTLKPSTLLNSISNIFANACFLFFSPGDSTPTVPSELPRVKSDISEEISSSCFEKNYKILIWQKLYKICASLTIIKKSP